MSLFIGPILPIILDNHLINCTTQSSSLTGTLDNKLCWAPRIKSLPANFNAKINLLTSPPQGLCFKGILQPNTTYCISLWGCSSYLQVLEESHIRAARRIHNLILSNPRHEVLSKVKWHYVSYIFKKRLACLAYQAYYNLAPPSITNLFTKHATSCNLRNNL